MLQSIKPLERQCKVMSLKQLYGQLAWRRIISPMTLAFYQFRTKCRHTPFESVMKTQYWDYFPCDSYGWNHPKPQQVKTVQIYIMKLKRYHLECAAVQTRSTNRGLKT